MKCSTLLFLFSLLPVPTWAIHFLQPTSPSLCGPEQEDKSLAHSLIKGLSEAKFEERADLRLNVYHFTHHFLHLKEDRSHPSNVSHIGVMLQSLVALTGVQLKPAQREKLGTIFQNLASLSPHYEERRSFSASYFTPRLLSHLFGALLGRGGEFPQDICLPFMFAEHLHFYHPEAVRNASTWRSIFQSIKLLNEVSQKLLLWENRRLESGAINL